MRVYQQFLKVMFVFCVLFECVKFSTHHLALIRFEFHSLIRFGHWTWNWSFLSMFIQDFFSIQSNFWDLCIFSNGHDIVIFTRKVYQQIRAWFRVSLTLFDQNIHVQHFPSFSLDWVRRNFEISKKLLLFTNIWYIHYWHDRIL